MVVNTRRELCDGRTLHGLFAAGFRWLEHHRHRVNTLNVFPVPDGDTGTNMHLTMQKAYDMIADLDEPHAGIVAVRLARGALRGARGNSGVILSQLMRGFADVMRGHETFDVLLLARAGEQAVQAAYNAVMNPTEGTILTVSRAAKDALADYAREGRDLTEALDAMLEAARAALDTTPDLLPILKKAGVVDSGGQGLVFILEGMTRILHGEPVYLGEDHSTNGDAAPAHENVAWQNPLEPEDEDGYGYDVQFLMHGSSLDVNAVRQAIDAMGWSTLVVGDPSLIKVHVHVHDPGLPLSYAIGAGASIDDVVVENMQLQYERLLDDRANDPVVKEVPGIAVVVVSRGEGMRDLFYDGLNTAYVIPGGQTMNPDTDAFLLAIESISNEHLILLPNNRNVVLAARQAASMASGKQVQVVPTTSIPQAISAMLATLDIRDTGDLAQVVAAMEEAASLVITCEITTAVRDSHLDDTLIREGQYIGLVDNDLVAAGDTVESVARDVLQKAGADERELITLYYGETIREADAGKLVDQLTEDFPEQQFEIVYGGQPHYPYIISVE